MEALISLQPMAIEHQRMLLWLSFEAKQVGNAVICKPCTGGVMIRSGLKRSGFGLLFHVDRISAAAGQYETKA
jgi:hypothetical protein